MDTGPIDAWLQHPRGPLVPVIRPKPIAVCTEEQTAIVEKVQHEASNSQVNLYGYDRTFSSNCYGVGLFSYADSGLGPAAQ